MHCKTVSVSRACVERTDVAFPSGSASCAGWLYRPAGIDSDVPCVVMADGFSLTRYDGLATYAEALAGAGAAALVYDHRFLGDSGGDPPNGSAYPSKKRTAGPPSLTYGASTESMRTGSSSGASH